MTTKNSTNSELQEAFGESLNDGQTIIFAKAPSSNPEYTTIYLCQAIKANRSASSAQEFFLGWTSNRLVRCIHNAATKIANNLKVGDVVPFDILITECVGPVYEGQQPKINPGTGEVVMFGEHEVYERTELVEKGKGRIVHLAKEEVANTIKVSETPQTAKQPVEAF